MVSRINSPTTLSPDGAGRFFMMAKILEAFYGGSRKDISLLDVGGSSPFMTSQLKNISFHHNLTAIDILPKPAGFKGTYVQGDATKMSFDSDTFDTVISTDVLEHIPLPMKDDFVRECIRVAKDYVVIAAPFNTEGVDIAEHATNDFNVKLFKSGQTWLEEHFEYKKPELPQVSRIAKDMGCETQVIGTNNIYTWILSTHVNLIEAKLGLNNRDHIKSNSLLNEHLLTSGDMVGPHYRHFVIIFKNSKTKFLEDKLHQMASPKIDHGPSITYFHELINLVANGMIKSNNELEYLRKSYYKDTQEMRTQIGSLNAQIVEKQVIIDRCRPYINLLRLHPKRIIRRRTK